MSKIAIAVLIFVFLSFFVGRELYVQDIEHNSTRDISNFTNNIFSNMSFNKTYISSSPRLQKVADSFIIFVRAAITEFMKYGIEFGYNNPQYDYPFFLEWVKLLVGLYVLTLIMPIIIPLLAVAYLLSYYLVKGIRFAVLWLKKELGK